MRNWDAIWQICKENYGTLQKKEEFCAMLFNLEDSKIKDIIKTGSVDPGNTRGFLEIGCNVVCVGYDFGDPVENLARSMGEDVLRLIRGDLHEYEVFATVETAMPVCDCLYIDGEYTEVGCRATYTVYSPLVRSGGLVVFNNILQEEVAKVWSDVVSSGRLSSEIISEPKTSGGIGVLYM
jgi:hypothetical protein